MCFSATASFAAAAFTGIAGAVALTRVRQAWEAPLAAMPLLFATQQAIEGALWLALPDGYGANDHLLAFWFLMFAQVVWPTFVPASVWLAEPSASRRKWMAPWILVGVLMSVYLLFGILTRGHSAQIDHHHIAYSTGQTNALLVGSIYLGTAAMALLFASSRVLQAMGGVIVTGAVAVFLFSHHAFQSVWCFFAASASILVAVHFWRRDLVASTHPAADLSAG